MAQVKGLSQFSEFAVHTSKQISQLAVESQAKAAVAKQIIEDTKDNALATQYQTLLDAYRTLDTKIVKEQLGQTLLGMSKLGHKFSETQKEWNKYESEMEEAVRASGQMISTLESFKIAPIDIPAEGLSDYTQEQLIEACKAIADLNMVRQEIMFKILTFFKDNTRDAIAGDWSLTLFDVMHRFEKPIDQAAELANDIKQLTSATNMNMEAFKSILSKLGSAMDVSASFGGEEVQAAKAGVKTIDTGLV